MSDQPIGRCQHCNVAQFDNPDGDPALDAMAHVCWKCVSPCGLIVPGMRVRRIPTETRTSTGTIGTVIEHNGADALVQWDGHDSRQWFATTELESVR